MHIVKWEAICRDFLRLGIYTNLSVAFVAPFLVLRCICHSSTALWFCWLCPLSSMHIDGPQCLLWPWELTSQHWAVFSLKDILVSLQNLLDEILLFSPCKCACVITHMCACYYVCECIYVYACYMYVHACTHMFVGVCVCLECVCMYVYMYVHTYMCACVTEYMLCVHVFVWVYVLCACVHSMCGCVWTNWYCERLRLVHGYWNSYILFCKNSLF